MKVDNAQLAAFATVLSEGSFELAARRLNVTPSAISQRIKLLEDRLGQVLIQRSSPCQPTAAGRRLSRYAQEVSLLEAEMFAGLGVRTEAASAAVRLPLVVNADSLDSWFTEVFNAAALDGSMTLDVRMEDQDHSMALLREGTVMAGVSASADPFQGCRVEPLGAMRYLAVASPRFMATWFSKGVDANSFGMAPMLRFNRKDALQGIFITRLTQQDISPPTHMVPSTASFLAAARAGLGWGMVPEQMAEPALNQGELQQMAPQQVLDVPLYWHRWRLQSTALDALSAMVHQAARQALR